jgi:hypothetical protein
VKKKFKTKKHGFALLTAIILLFLISYFSVTILSLSTTSSSESKDLYLYNQAELLGRSAIELSVLHIGAYDFSQGKCLNNIDMFYPDKNNPIFEINVSIRYIGNNICQNSSEYNKSIFISGVQFEDSNISALIDVFVKSTFFETPISFHRRTLQKP